MQMLQQNFSLTFHIFVVSQEFMIDNNI